MRLLPFILLAASLLLPHVSYAYSSIADIPQHAVESSFAAWNHSTQKEADRVAIEGCKALAMNAGIQGHANKCRVTLRQKAPGGGAIVCGDDGCSYVTGYETKQLAVDGAYDHCRQRYKNCRQNGILGWWDEAGYQKKPIQTPAAGKTCGPPPGRAVRSYTQCNNGDCIRTFENGCQIRFQAAYCRDPVSGQWGWQADGC